MSGAGEIPADEIKDGMRFEHGSTIYRYRGYDIRFNENSDLWSCRALNVEHAQLSVVKDAIGKLDAKARKMDGVPVLIIGSYYGVDYTPAQATLLDADGKGVWVNVLRNSGRIHGAVIEKREKMSLDRILLDTPENRAALDALHTRMTACYEEQKAIRNEAEALPRWEPPKAQPVETLPEYDSQKLSTRPIRRSKRP